MFWKKGRQNTGYETFTLIKQGFNLGKLTGFDLHIIKYNDGNYIPPHTDPVDENNHYRFNFIIKKPKSGGVFECEKYFKFGRLIIFRPDQYIHSVSRCVGSRYVLSFGLAIKNKQKSIL